MIKLSSVSTGVMKGKGSGFFNLRAISTRYQRRRAEELMIKDAMTNTLKFVELFEVDDNVLKS